MDRIYIVDTSSWVNLIFYYPKNVFPTIWNKLDNLIKEEKIISPQMVKQELPNPGNAGEIYELYKLFNEKMFIQSNTLIMQNIAEITSKYYANWSEEEEADFADPYVTAVALTYPASIRIIVTEDSQESGKIPFVAKQYGIEPINLLQLFNREQWKF